MLIVNYQRNRAITITSCVILCKTRKRKIFDYFPFIFKYHFQHLITKLEFRKSNNYKLNFGKDVIKKIL